MAVNSTLFVAIPTLALLLNLFLLLICVSAKQNRLVKAFMFLVLAFSLWTGGSAGMRSTLYPGPAFWYDVSMTGIYLSPFLFYNFVHHYTSKKGWFTWAALAAGWLIMLILQWAELFMRSPQILISNGSRSFSYEITALIALPFALAIITVLLGARLIHQSVKRQLLLMHSLVPVFLGAAIMVLGVAASAILEVKSFPIDPLACGINAILLFYALYRRRLITLRMVTGRAPVYLAAVVWTFLLVVLSHPLFNRLYAQYFPNYPEHQMLVMATLASVTTVLTYNMLKALLARLFDKGNRQREEELRSLSLNINQSLNLAQIMINFGDFIERNIAMDAAYICVQEPSGDFVTEAKQRPVLSEPIRIRHDSPLLTWLAQQGSVVSIRDFTRTQHYRAMWDIDRDWLSRLMIRCALPVTQGGRLITVVLLADADSRADLSPRDALLLESAAAVVSIAAKNAMLYSAMQDEANHDGLTGLYNRRHFVQQARQLMAQCGGASLSLAIISLDDFQLYNELHGAHQGDRLLQDLSQLIQSAVGGQGLLGRHGGKEFILALPYKDGAAAAELVGEVRSLFRDYLKRRSGEGVGYCTFSAGISSYPHIAFTLEDAIEFAGIALYAAKKSGKNRSQQYLGPAQQHPTPEAQRLGEQSMQTVYALMAAIDAKDHYTFNHSQNVSVYASRLAEVIGLDQAHVDILRQAGLLHDIGKIGIPEGILSKEGPLTPEEWEVMRQHVEGSIAMIRYLPQLDYVTPVVIGHHERWDGTGYPRGLSGEEIPVGARCLCIADAFDAMTTNRGYKEARSVEQALDQISKGLGTQFDPRIGQAFIEGVREGSIRVLRRA